VARVSDLDLLQRGRRYLVGAVMVVIGGVVGYALPRSTAQPATQPGTVTAVRGDNGTVTSIVFKPRNGTAQTLRLGNPTPWRTSSGGPWHTGRPACLDPGSAKPVLVTLGVVDLDSAGTPANGPMVVWVGCYG